jgi:hypothetical protein
MTSAIEPAISDALGPMALPGMFGGPRSASARNNFAATFGAQLLLPTKTEVIPSTTASTSQALVGGGQPGSAAGRKSPAGKSSLPLAANPIPISPFLPTSQAPESLRAPVVPNVNSAFPAAVIPVDAGAHVVANSSETAVPSLPSFGAVTASQNGNNFAQVSFPEPLPEPFSLSQGSLDQALPNSSAVNQISLNQPSLNQRSVNQASSTEGVAISTNSSSLPTMVADQPPENNLMPTAETSETMNQNSGIGVISSDQTVQQGGSVVGNSQPPAGSNAVPRASFTEASVIASAKPPASLIAQEGPTPVQSQNPQSSTATQPSTASESNNAFSVPSPTAPEPKPSTAPLPQLAVRGSASLPAAALPNGLPPSAQLQPMTAHANSDQSNAVMANLSTALQAHVAVALATSSLELRQSLPLSVGPSMAGLQPKMSPGTSMLPTTPASQLGESSARANTAVASPNHIAAGNSNPASVSPTQNGASSRDSQNPTTPKQNPSTNQNAVIVAAQTPDLQPGSAQPVTTVATGPTLQVTASPAPATFAGKSSTVPAGSSESTPNPPAANDVPSPQTASPVQMAQIVSKAAQTEMRIGLNTSAFGSVEVRTTVHANDVGVLIGSEKGDLRSLLTNELPGIANTLQQQNLRLNQVNFQQGGFAFSGNLSSGSDSQPRYFSPARPFDSSPQGDEAAMDDSAAALEGVGSSSTGLSILA